MVSDLFGVSGWAILDQIAQGQSDVEEMVQQARGALSKKKGELREALQGRLDPVYRLLLGQQRDQVRLGCATSKCGGSGFLFLGP